jgi:mono/diheme cytochrome c family protein
MQTGPVTTRSHGVAVVLSAVLAALLLTFGLAEARSGTADVPDGDLDRGQELYAANCAMCHGVDATGMMGMHPALTGVVDRLTLEGVEVAIRNGRNTQPPMPAFGDQLTEEDMADLIAYLESLPPGPRHFGPELMFRDGTADDVPGMREMMDEMMRTADRVARCAAVAAPGRGAGCRHGGIRHHHERSHTHSNRPSPFGARDPRPPLCRWDLSTEEYRQRRADLDS